MFSVDRRRRTNNRLEFLRSKAVGTLETGQRPSFWAGWPVRAVLLTLTLLASTMILAMGGPPFAYREGQYTQREIRLAHPLQIENVTETRNARERAGRESPWVFSHNPRPVVLVREGIHKLSSSIAAVETFDEFNSVLANEWGINSDLFSQLRKEINSAATVKKFNDAIDRVLDPFVRFGLLDSASIPTDAKRDTSVIEIRPVGENVKYLPKMDAIFLPMIPQDDGVLTKSLRVELGKDLAVPVLKVLVPKLTPTLTFDESATKLLQRSAIENVEPVVDEYAANSLVVPAGTIIGPEQLRLLASEHAEMISLRTWLSADRYKRWLGLATIVTGVAILGLLYLRITEPRISRELRHSAILCSLVVATLAIARLFEWDPYRAQLIPIAVGSFYLAISYGRPIGVMSAIAWSLLVAVIHADPLTEFAVLAGGTTAGVLLLNNVRSRTKPIIVGLATGTVAAGIAIGLGLILDYSAILVATDAARLFGCGLIAGFVMSGSLPFVESLLGIVTDISLIELADSSHPLLQDLVRKAPGTHNHSVSVSIIAEAAAKAIGCNSLAVRVGALFHDVGKMLKPQYFIENKGPDDLNRHDHLAPAISTLIIIGHVKDGMELGRQHHLPRVIMNLIEQHHGTTLVDYFFHEASREQQSNPDSEEEVDETAFRYPGPKPQSKEAAVMMLADCVESASRALSDPTPARIEKLVHNLTLNRLLDGQFEECGITLQEIHTIEQSLKKSLTSVYHGRIKYPAAV
ncbi:HDIG domain-containing protein [bacterium]|nr:HDIG domain-containing protein [bacterium]